MKTILSLSTLAAVTALTGLLPWAFGESKAPGKGTAPKPVESSLQSSRKSSPIGNEPLKPGTGNESSSAAANPRKVATEAGSPSATKTSRKDSLGKSSTSGASGSRKDTSRSSSESASTKSSARKPSAEPEKLPLTEAQENKLLTLLNEGTIEDLDAIPGIAATRADSIVSARPYGSVHEIILVEGVGNATFEKILAYGKSLTQRSVSPVAGTRKS